TIVLDGGEHPTEINEAGPEVEEARWRELLAALPAGRLVVSGSLPPGTAPERFGELLGGLVGPHAAPLTVDAHGPALIAALRAGADLVAPNRRELEEAAAALPLEAGSDLDAAEALPDDLPGAGALRRSVALATALRRRFGSRVLVTLGEAGAVLVAARTWLARAARVDAVNPIGSGDCLLGAFLWAEEAGLREDEALALGVAAGADNARRGGGGTLDGASVRALAARVRLEAVS
ncbi:MAG TPA: PfkB family carbohydrate kinase, partial [Trueperaceae bacterium]|nr:PfkB family carbohydrate kinase [Trueperaceae bacterium]